MSDIELKCLQEKLEYKEHFQAEKINSYELKKKRIGNVIKYSVWAIILSIVLIFLVTKLGRWFPMLGVFSGGIVAPCCVIIVISIILIPVFAIKYYLYSHVQGRIDIGFIHLNAGGTLLSQINENEREICRLKNRISYLKEEKMYSENADDDDVE